MGSPLGLVEKMRAIEAGDYLLVATDGALLKVMENVDGSWRAVPQMGGGWVIGIAKKGTNPELLAGWDGWSGSQQVLFKST